MFNFLSVLIKSITNLITIAFIGVIILLVLTVVMPDNMVKALELIEGLLQI